MTTLLQDLKYALRVLLKSPGFSLAAVIVLALGIGANTAIFSVVNAVLLRPLPYPDPSRIMQVWHVPPPKSFSGVTWFAVSPANYLDWRTRNHLFEQLAAYGFEGFSFAGKDGPEAIQAAAVAPDFFTVLRVRPSLGRLFTTEDDQPGHGKVAILGYAFWQARFASDSNIIGRSIRLNGENYEVVGVMAPKFQFPGWAQLWVPLAWTPETRAVRGNHNYAVIGRLHSGADRGQAQQEMTAISIGLEQEYPEDDKGWGALVRPLHDEIVGNVRTALVVLLGAVGFVLLIACANVANLVLAKTLAPRRSLFARRSVQVTLVCCNKSYLRPFCFPLPAPRLAFSSRSSELS